MDRLGAAFAARDVDAALECFIPDADITYIGSEAGERAEGRAAVAALFTALFARPEAYSWRAREVSVHRCDRSMFLLAEADGVAESDAGQPETFGYRVSGLLELVDGVWRWRVCQGSEPT
ncbi:MAG TPA: nuclear transport factor 2 family protein [Pseudonocardiaceae bacterium]|nr:nuclear transport factor 2 family protein [Pseudonocardiaceae bacterium]